MDYWPRIKALLEAREWELADLARATDRTDFPQDYKTLHQAQRRKGMSLDMAIAVSAALGLTLDQFLHGNQAAPPDDRAADAAERELLTLYRAVDWDRKDDLLALGQRWYKKAREGKQQQAAQADSPAGSATAPARAPSATTRKPAFQRKRPPRKAA